MPAVHTLNDKPVLLVVYAGNFKSLNEAFDSIKVFVLPYYRNYKYEFNCSLVGYLCIHRLMLSLTSFS
ncbi:hypothetical protein DOM00_21520 [Salmonella enterica subsp. enterica serovar Derby]|nr:hypothetical protein DOM00_21520 [Salmonella enterica subsp. enterica serovar Derby]